MSSSASFDRLPQEICHQICFFVPDNVWRVTCHSLVLTCRSWHAVAEPLLYRDIQLDGEDQSLCAVKHLARTISTRPDLATFIHSLHSKNVAQFESFDKHMTNVVVNSPKMQRITLELIDSSAAVLHALASREHCRTSPPDIPNTPLRELAVYSTDYEGPQKIMPDAISPESLGIIMNLPALDEVIFVDPDLDEIVMRNKVLSTRLLTRSPMAHTVRRLQSKCCCSDSLEIDAGEGESQSASLPKFLRVFEELETLVITFTYLGGPYFRAEVGKAIHKFTKSLKRLVLYLSPNIPLNMMDFQHPSQEVEFLEDRVGSVAAFERLTYIEMEVDELWIPRLNDTLASCLPSSVQHVHLSNPTTEALRMPLEDAFCTIPADKNRRLRPLETLSCHPQESEKHKLPTKTSKALATCCAENGVALVPAGDYLSALHVVKPYWATREEDNVPLYTRSV